MKTKIIITTCLWAMLFSFSCCKNGQKQEDATEQISSVEYECPMKCEGSKSDKPGTCPVCKMDLEKVEQGTEAEHDESTEHEHSSEHHDSTDHENHNH